MVRHPHSISFRVFSSKCFLNETQRFPPQNKVEHNGSGLSSGGNLAAHGAQTTAPNVPPLKIQGGQIVIDVSAKSLQQGSQQPVERDRSQVSQQVTSIAGPPGLDKSSVSSVAPLQTHKPSITGSTQSQQATVPSSYHSQAQQQSQVSSGSSGGGAGTNYQQYSSNSAYKQPPNNMPYLHNLSGIYNAAHSTTQYSQQASQPYGSAAYSTAFGEHSSSMKPTTLCILEQKSNTRTSPEQLE